MTDKYSTEILHQPIELDPPYGSNLISSFSVPSIETLLGKLTTSSFEPLKLNLLDNLMTSPVNLDDSFLPSLETTSCPPISSISLLETLVAPPVADVLTLTTVGIVNVSTWEGGVLAIGGGPSACGLSCITADDIVQYPPKINLPKISRVMPSIVEKDFQCAPRSEPNIAALRAKCFENGTLQDTIKLPTERRVMPNVICDGIQGVSPMVAPKDSIADLRKRYGGTPVHPVTRIDPINVEIPSVTQQVSKSKMDAGQSKQVVSVQDWDKYITLELLDNPSIAQRGARLSVGASDDIFFAVIQKGIKREPNDRFFVPSVGIVTADQMADRYGVRIYIEDPTEIWGDPISYDRICIIDKNSLPNIVQFTLKENTNRPLLDTLREKTSNSDYRPEKILEDYFFPVLTPTKSILQEFQEKSRGEREVTNSPEIKPIANLFKCSWKETKEALCTGIPERRKQEMMEVILDNTKEHFLKAEQKFGKDYSLHGVPADMKI